MNTPAAEISAGRRRAELRGRAAGAAVLALFALGWTACGIMNLPTTVGLVLFIAAAVGSLILVVLAVRMSRRAATAPAGAPVGGKATARRYAIIVAFEWIAIFVLAWSLGATGHPSLIPAAVALGVGVHFFPLGNLFGVRVYHLTGAALCLVALVTGLLVPLTGTPVLWSALPGFGSALTLYVTCVHLLRTR
jgi:hypothetical protein